MFSYPVARAYKAEHDSKWGYVRMPAVTNIVMQKPKVAACQKSRIVIKLVTLHINAVLFYRFRLINNGALALRSFLPNTNVFCWLD